MSGPKRADVQAALNTAARSAQASAAIIATADRAAVRQMGQRLAEVLQDAANLRSALEHARGDLASGGHHGPDIAAAMRAVEEAIEGLDSSIQGTDTLTSNTRDADQAEEKAKRAYDDAQAEYDKAEQGLRQSGGHYLRNQMAWAQNAQRKFDEAGKLGKKAADSRKASKKVAGRVVERAEAAVAAARRAQATADGAIRAAEKRARAAAEAARIAEEKRREASSAAADARVAVDSLNVDDVDKFAPGVRGLLAERVDGAERALAAGEFDAVHKAVRGVVAEASKTATECDEARRKWDEARAAARAAQAGLESQVSSVDSELVEAWARNTDAMAQARAAAERVGTSIDLEAFDEAVRVANAALDDLAAATSSAAEAKGQDLRRREVGEAVMDVLEDLGFDISYEDGTRDDPLRISGQTATPDGRGDFDIEIPLDGEIDFEVTAPEGDVTCVNAIRSLQEQLAERGVDWTVTDWGHAEGHVDGATKVKSREKTQTRSRSKGK